MVICIVWYSQLEFHLALLFRGENHCNSLLTIPLQSPQLNPLFLLKKRLLAGYEYSPRQVPSINTLVCSYSVVTASGLTWESKYFAHHRQSYSFPYKGRKEVSLEGWGRGVDNSLETTQSTHVTVSLYSVKEGKGIPLNIFAFYSSGGILLSWTDVFLGSYSGCSGNPKLKLCSVSMCWIPRGRCEMASESWRQKGGLIQTKPLPHPPSPSSCERQRAVVLPEYLGPGLWSQSLQIYFSWMQQTLSELCIGTTRLLATSGGGSRSMSYSTLKSAQCRPGQHWDGCRAEQTPLQNSREGLRSPHSDPFFVDLFHSTMLRAEHSCPQLPIRGSGVQAGLRAFCLEAHTFPVSTSGRF